MTGKKKLTVVKAAEFPTDIEPNAEMLMISELSMETAGRGGGGDGFDAISEDTADQVTSSVQASEGKDHKPEDGDRPVIVSKKSPIPYLPVGLAAGALLLGTPGIFKYGP